MVVNYNCKANASHASQWCCANFIVILMLGYSLYTHHSNFSLIIRDPSALSINDNNYVSKFSSSCAGDLHMSYVRKCFIPPQDILNMLRKDCDASLLTIETNTVAIIIDSIGRIRIFDSNSKRYPWSGSG